MNRLIERSTTFCDSMEERLELLESLMEKGYVVPTDVQQDIDCHIDYREYPCVTYTNNYFTVSRESSLDGTYYTVLTKPEFMLKVGLGDHTPQGDSKLIHKFI